MNHLLQARPVFARPLPAVRSAILLRARPSALVVRATESDNETPREAAEPTIFYGGKSFSETEWSKAVERGSVTDTSTSAAAASTQEITESPGFDEIMAFNGKAPEITNGRLAMLGFLAAVAAELATGKSTLAQWAQEPTAVTLTFVLFMAASLAPIFNRADGKERLGPFTPAAELLNGRAAMIGFAALIGIEALKGSALF